MGAVDRAAEQRWIERLATRWESSPRYRIRPAGRRLAISALDPARPVWSWLDGGGGLWTTGARVTWSALPEAEDGVTRSGGVRLEARGSTPADVERELERQLIGALEADLRRWFPVRGTVLQSGPDGAWVLGEALDGAWVPGMVLGIARSDGLARLRIRADGLAEAIARPGDWKPGLEVQEALETSGASTLWITVTSSGTAGCELAWGHAMPGWAPVVAVEGREGIGLVGSARQSEAVLGGWGAWEGGLVAVLEGRPGAPRQALDARLALCWMHDLGWPSLWVRIRLLGQFPLVVSTPGSAALGLPEVGIGVAF